MKSKAEHYVTWRCVTIRIRRVVTGGCWMKRDIKPAYPTLDPGSTFIPKLSRYELTHNGRYLWSDTNWKRALKHARAFADKIADQRKVPQDGE